MSAAELRYQRGFGSFFETEAVAGALPLDRNSPRRVAHGLYAEQLNGVAFTVPRGGNQRSWTYRIRPSCTEAGYQPFDGAAELSLAYLGGALDPNLLGWKPLALELDRATDFVSGLHTFGGAGDPADRRGFAVHLYVANTSMSRRAFSSADGDLMILPDTGRLSVVTELGRLEVAPGQLAVVPRGIKLAVELIDDVARGYLGESYSSHFRLPERGPIGANFLAEARHFEHPIAWFDDSDDEHEIICKVGGRLWRANRPGSPFDVVAWHGNYAPYRYDLSLFAPVGSVAFDHPDPSIFSVLSSPLDHPGENALDLIIFPSRWEVSEGTFRPPYYHRNAATELNGILTGTASDHVFSRGGYFLTPPMSGHGIAASVTDRYLERSDDQADQPERAATDSLWFQFESTLPLRLSPWAQRSPNRDHTFGQLPRSATRRFGR